MCPESANIKELLPFGIVLEAIFTDTVLSPSAFAWGSG
jgi:hypothetical protein